MEDQPNQEDTRAAGGLLWRRTPYGFELAVIYRARYDDWSLPKGKLKKNETWQQGALREVAEETGWQAQLAGFAGALAYPVQKGVKVVRYWHMLAVGDGPQEFDQDEISAVVWLPMDQARRRVHYPLEKALLEAWDGPGTEE